MSGAPELPRGWNPETDSLEDLVHILFDDDRPGALDTESGRPSTPTGTANPTAAPVDSPPPPPASAPEPTPDVGRRPGFAVPALAAAILLALSLAGWHIRTAPTATVTLNRTGAQVAAGGTPSTTAPAPTPVAPTLLAAPAPEPAPAPAPAPTPPAPTPIGIAFGGRADLNDGWRLASTRPYPCDVLMAIPVLQRDGTRIVRVTLTLTNRTGVPARANAWQLAATADGNPAELVLWPAERFRGVPDVTLAPRRSVRFLVAIRVPEQRTQLEITASRDAFARVVLTGSF